MHKRTAYVKALTAFFIWSLLGPALNLSSFTSFQSVVIQTTTGAMIILLLLLYKRKLSMLLHIRFTKQILIFIFLAGGANALIYKAITLIPIASAFLILSSGPIIAIIIEVLFFKKTLQPIRAIAIAGGIIGIAILLSQNISVSATTSFFTGALVMLIATFFAVSRDFIAKEITKKYSLDIVVFIILLSGVGMSLPFAFQSPWIFNTNSLISGLFFGIFGSVVAFYFYIGSLKILRVSTSSILGYIQPLLASLWGILFLSQQLSVQTIIGGCFILFAAFLAVKSGE